MKKTSPKKLHPMGHTDRQTDKQTDGHGDSMTDPAQRAESVKKDLIHLTNFYPIVQCGKHVHGWNTYHAVYYTCFQLYEGEAVV